MSRTASIARTTAETDISLTLELDGSGAAQISSGCAKRRLRRAIWRISG